MKYGKEIYVKDEKYAVNTRLNVLRDYLEFSRIYKHIKAEILK
ncbi:MAG: hypothetical protein N3A65_06425 [candidate division WOR-3 bacterium]|nr:hypothetical protein [candidate division WOR-3 bacterium]